MALRRSLISQQQYHRRLVRSLSSVRSLSDDGLVRHEVIAEDGHPLRVYQRPLAESYDPCFTAPSMHSSRKILLVHGRTWSSRPVYDLNVVDSESAPGTLSLLMILSSLGIDAHAVDLRGFGETAPDSSGYCRPSQCCKDLRDVMKWLEDRPTLRDTADDEVDVRPALLGWSQGAMVAMLFAQQYPEMLNDLILYASIYDPRNIFKRQPIFHPNGQPKTPPKITNTLEGALEDFTLPGSISDYAADAFGVAALEADPTKVIWADLHELNACNPAQITTPTLLLHGDQDPYVSMNAQRELFERIGCPDKAWTVLPNSDHAVHLLHQRHMFVRAVVGFLSRKEAIPGWPNWGAGVRAGYTL